MSNQKENRQSERQNRESSGFNYLRYSGLAFEMLAFILLGVWGGYKLDQVLEMTYPIFTIFLSLGGVTASLVYLIKNLPKE